MPDCITGKRYHPLKEFLPFYLGEHPDPVCWVLHFIVFALIPDRLIRATTSDNAWWSALVPLRGYRSTWIGQTYVDRNRPATFQVQPSSVMSDFLPCRRPLTDHERFRS